MPKGRYGARWPTVELTDSLVPGQLKWPAVISDDPTNSGNQYLVDSAPTELSFISQANSGMYSDVLGKLYRATDYEGLRGTYFIRDGVVNENTSALQRYQLWEWIGWAADKYLDPTDIAFINGLNVEHANRMAKRAEEAGLPAVREMYFWDGHSRHDDGGLKFSLYYTDGQGQRTTGVGTVGIDFYEMLSSSVADDWVKDVQAGVRGQGRNPGGRRLNPDGTRPWERQRAVPGAEDDAGENSAEEAYQRVYATTLAWQRLSEFRRIHASVGAQKRRQRTGLGNLGDGNVGFVDTEATNTMYEIYRPQMLDAVSTVFKSIQLGGIGGSPDHVQSRIQAMLRTKLLSEGFTSAWIEVFYAEEQIETITPEGFDVYGMDQGRRPVVAGSDPGTRNDRTNPGDYTTYPYVAPLSPPASRVVVHAPFGYLVPPGGTSGPRGGPPNTQLDNWTKPQLLQRYPHDYSFANYTLHTLNPRIAKDEIFYFDYAPSNVSYQGLGAQWVEVPRSGDLPIVEFSSWSLMKVSMDFLIANTVTSSMGVSLPDGLVTGIYEKIEVLRRMAQRPYPISVFHLDQLLRVSMRRAETTGKPLEFVISDLSISSMRRTIEAGNKEITTAQIKLTLQEMPVESIKSVRFGKPNIVVPLMPSDASNAAKDSAVGPSPEALKAIEARGSQDVDPEVYQAWASANPGQASNTTINSSGGQAAIDYDGYDEWGSSQ